MASIHANLLKQKEVFLYEKGSAPTGLAWCANMAAASLFCKGPFTQAILSRQLSAIFVALKLQLQNRTCKPGAISSAICPYDIAGVSNMFET